MNAGYVVLGLGILGIVAGVALYISRLHRTIGLGGVGLGVALVLIGIMIARGAIKMSPTPAPAS